MASNKEIIYNYLKEKGLNDMAIAGVMGNIQQESNFNPTAKNSSSGAYGIFQWLGGRKTNLENYAKEKGTSIGNIYTQLDFFWYEINHSESKTKTVLTSNKYNTPSEYAVAFESSFERSGGSGNTKRKSYAESIYEWIKGGVESLTTSNTTTGNGVKWFGDIVVTLFSILLVIMGVVFIGLAVTSNKTGKDIVEKIVKEV